MQAWDKFFEVKHAQSEEVQELLNKLLQDVRNVNEELAEYINTPSWNHPAFYYDDDNDDDDDDKDYTIAITPVLPTMEPEHSLSMGDEHLSTILEKEESSVEDLILIPSESEGILDNMCDVPFRDNSPPLSISKDQFEDFSNSNDDSTSIDDDSFSIDDINYVKASPPDSEPVSLEVVEIVIPEVGGIDTDILLTIKDDILREKLLNVNLLIAKIETLKDNPIPSFDFVTKSSSTSLNFFLEETDISYNSLPEFETFCFNLEKKSSGNPTSYSDLSLPDYEAFFCDSEPDSGDFTIDVDEFSISFICDPLSPVINTLLPFLSKNEDKVINSGILAVDEEKSPHPLSHRGLRTFNESPMMIFGEDTSNLDVLIARIFEASRARSFVLRSLELHILSFILGIQYPNLID
ncbi:hypothetical protein Tco_0874783 [Tanacetum coccineum]|uniref:Reverse transcriptase domain-containing protein n=1 Tax=Tanacetum coccineum TaxID=301880 RepID=A0ABQ5BQK7_9ASTR